jgi:hypothetical protein
MARRKLTLLYQLVIQSLPGYDFGATLEQVSENTPRNTLAVISTAIAALFADDMAESRRPGQQRHSQRNDGWVSRYASDLAIVL